ncbi:MAG TPA: GIY-YIG nuclease family protein [Methanocorpusculum sp.]|nr:GIY-YIG nuclease family protein [Methanocorpusculum sp.]
MDKGVYCLILSCRKTCTILIGALGKREFQEGRYIYVGSALGSGGLSRVTRHIRFFHEHYRKPKWHIDYLMAAGEMILTEVICAKTEEKLECILAKNIGGSGIKNFGCSDCFCGTHLFYRENQPTAEVTQAFQKTGLIPVHHLVH